MTRPALAVHLLAAILAMPSSTSAASAARHAAACRADVVSQDPGPLGAELRMRALYDACRADGLSAEAKGRLQAFWATHDRANATNPAYLLEKATILGWIDEDDEAARVFRLVPDEALVAPHHLLQRIRESVDQSPDRALALVLRLARIDCDKVSSWVHDSYAQRLAPRPGDGFDAAAQRHLLVSLAAPESPARAIVPGLLAWLDALSGADTPEHLRIVLARPLGDDAARAHRYRLLLLDRALRHDALLAEVRDSLEKLIAALESEAIRPDATASAPRRARIHYYLAHACHTFANKFCGDDRQGRIAWLQRSARWAPDAADQEAGGALFYERVCLGGAHDYAGLCATELGRLGRTQEAVRLWLERILVSPDQLQEARREILRLDPDADFDDLLHDIFEDKLPLVTDLALSTPTGDTIRLASYRGRWVLLDFWGTWCAPCRQELPTLVALHHDVRAHAGGGAAVLTVACNDKPETVTKFLAQHDYDLPVVMGDDAVADAFAVSGYPTKVLITPTGRWMKLAYGRVDWNALARQLMLRR